jgi:hypothetical protein
MRTFFTDHSNNITFCLDDVIAVEKSYKYTTIPSIKVTLVRNKVSKMVEIIFLDDDYLKRSEEFERLNRELFLGKNTL